LSCTTRRLECDEKKTEGKENPVKERHMGDGKDQFQKPLRTGIFLVVKGQKKKPRQKERVGGEERKEGWACTKGHGGKMGDRVGWPCVALVRGGGCFGSCVGDERGLKGKKNHWRRKI